LAGLSLLELVKELNVKITTTSLRIIDSESSEGHVHVVCLASELNLE